LISQLYKKKKHTNQTNKKIDLVIHITTHMSQKKMCFHQMVDYVFLMHISVVYKKTWNTTGTSGPAGTISKVRLKFCQEAYSIDITFCQIFVQISQKHYNKSTTASNTAKRIPTGTTCEMF
jgi:hypothetical protein